MPSREEVGRAILIAKDPTSTWGELATIAPVLADALLLAPADEHERLRGLVQRMVDRHVELGRARDADRWRAFNEWLRVNKPNHE